MTVDNEYTLFLDGRNVGRGAEWRHLGKYDLTQLLSSGKHVLAVEAYNVDAAAGMICGMRIDLADGRIHRNQIGPKLADCPRKDGRLEDHDQGPGYLAGGNDYGANRDLALVDDPRGHRY